MAQMTDWEICDSYRRARKPDEQIQVLAELNNVRQTDIIKVLLGHGIRISERAERKLYRRLEELEAKIKETEREYREIVDVMARMASAGCGNGGAKDGNGIQRHGRTEQK